MQLLKLQMRNFKRYRHQDVVFRDGITGIVGNNGTGKSTLVDAILFCLYGLKGTRLDFILGAAAGPQDRAEVRLDFSVRGEEYQVYRSIDRRKKHEAQVNQGGRLLAKGVSEVQEALLRIVRMGHADFRHTIFSGQRELLALVDTTPEERKRWFRRVLGIDRIKDEGGEILRAEAGAGREQMLLIEGRLKEVSREELGRQLGTAEEQMAETEREIARLGEEGSSLEARKGGVESRLQDLGERARRDFSARNEMARREQDLAGVRKEIARAAREVATLERNRAEFEDLSAAERDFESLRGRFTEGVQRLHAFQGLTAREEEKRARTREGRAELRGLREEDARMGGDEERMKVLEPSSGKREEARERLSRLRTMEERSRALQGEIAKQEVAISELAKRGGPLRSRREQIQEAGDRLAALAAGAGIPAGEKGEVVGALEERRVGLIRREADDAAALDLARANLAKLDADLATLEEQGPGGTCPTCRQPLGDRHRHLVDGIREERSSLGRTIASLGKEISGTRQAMHRLGPLLEEARDLAAICGRADEVAREWEEIQERTLAAISRRDELEGELSLLGYDPEEGKRLELELRDLENDVRELAVVSERLKGRESLVRKMRDLQARLGRLEEECRAIGGEIRDLGFDPAAHGRLEEEYRVSEARHRRYLELRPEMDRLPILEEQEKGLKAREASLTGEVATLVESIEAIAFSREDLERAREELGQVQRQATEIAARQRGLAAERAGHEKERKRLAGVIGKLERDRKEHDRLAEEIQLLELTREHLNGFTDHLLGVVRDQVQEETGRVLAEITDDRYDTVILDDSFELLVHDLGGDYPVSRFSGGEQDDVAIALRIALSRYIAGTHELHDSTFLIFDEIFGSQDEERRGNIFRALRALEPYFPQIFLISHVSEVQGEFGNTLVVEAVSERESRIRDTEGAAG